MKNFLLASAAVLALSACSQQSSDSNAGSEPAQQAQNAKAELGDFGIETQYIDANVDPGDDFYRYVNAGWLDTFEIPDEFSSYGSFKIGRAHV